LYEAFQVSLSSKVVLSGVNHDKWFEPWWSLGQANRATIIAAIAKLEISLVTVPNFSLVLDNPRMDDLHSMKRIALLFAEFQNAGIRAQFTPAREACTILPDGGNLSPRERKFKRFLMNSSQAREISSAGKFVWAG
jgi:hypothetical protein